MFTIIKFFLTGWMLRILIVVAIIYGLYAYKIWPFNNNVSDLNYLKQKYSTNSAEDLAVQTCILNLVEKDINKRFTAQELEALQTDRLKSAYALQRSLQIIKEQAKSCLTDKNQPNTWRQFNTDLATLDNKLLGKVGNLINGGVDKLKAEWDSRQQEKEALDAKYN